MILQVVSADIKTMSGKEFNIVNGIVDVLDAGCNIYPEYEKVNDGYRVFTDTVYVCRGNVDMVIKGAGVISPQHVEYRKKGV